MSDLIPASVRLDLPPDALLDAAILSIRSVRHSSDMHRGAISWLSETLWPAIGDMALELRAGGVIEPEDGWSLRGLGIHSRHRSDLLLSGPDARIHVMVDHLPRMTAAGMEADMRLREAEGRDYIRSILDPGPERLAFHDTASNWLDPAAGELVSSIGARALAQGEDPVSDIRERSLPDYRSPGLLCHLRPNLSFHERLCDTPALSTHPPCDDPFAELRVLELMSRALVLHGFGERVAARNAWLSGMEWVQYGDAGAALRQGAGMRLAHEAGGLVTAELRTAMARLECAAVGRMLEDSLHDIRSLPGMLRVSGALDEGSGFTCNDARDRIWSTFSDGTETLHVDCAAGRLALEMDEGGGDPDPPGGCRSGATPGVRERERHARAGHGEQPCAVDGGDPELQHAEAFPGERSHASPVAGRRSSTAMMPRQRPPVPAASSRGTSSPGPPLREGRRKRGSWWSGNSCAKHRRTFIFR